MRADDLEYKTKEKRSQDPLAGGQRSERKENGLLIQVGTFGLISRSERFWKKFKCGEILAKKVPKEENELAGTKGLKKLLKEILGVKPYTGFWLCDIYSKDGKPIGRIPIRDAKTYKRTISDAVANGYAVLKRGLFDIPGEVWKDYKGGYVKGDWLANAKRGLKVFKEERLTRLAPYILMDFDDTPEEDIKRLVSYLYKLGIRPDVWQSASGNGYHIYIKLIGNYATKYDIVKEKKIKTVYSFLPYASDYRIELCEKALKELCKRLNIKYDFISSKHAVFEEGVPNPLKGGKASKKVLNGKPHRLDKLTEKLRPFWEAVLREEARQRFLAQVLRAKPKPKVDKEQGQEKGYYAGISVQETECSNPIDYLQANISTAFRMLDRGYTWAEIEAELRNHWHGDPKAFDRAFKGFQKWIEDHYKPPKTTRRKPPKQRKHKHYWEYVDAIYEVLSQNPTASIREIAKATGIPKSSIGDILKVFTREQILAEPEQVKEYLRANEKGGDRLTEEAKEELRERGKERFRKFFEDFLKQVLRPKPKTKERKNRIQDSITYREAVITLDLSDQESVRIGHISITLPKEESREVGGLRPAQNPQNPKSESESESVFSVSRVFSVSSSLTDKSPKIVSSLSCTQEQDAKAIQRINALLDLAKEVFLRTKPLPEPKLEMIKAIGYSGTFTPAPLWQEMATWCYAELLKRGIVALDGTKFDEEKLERERPDIVEKLLELFHLIAKRYNSAGAPENESSVRALNERTTNDGVKELRRANGTTPKTLSHETEAKAYTDGAPRGQQKALIAKGKNGRPLSLPPEPDEALPEKQPKNEPNLDNTAGAPPNGSFARVLTEETSLRTPDRTTGTHPQKKNREPERKWNTPESERKPSVEKESPQETFPQVKSPLTKRRNPVPNTKKLKAIHKELSEVLEIFKNMETLEDYTKAVRKLKKLKDKLEAEVEKKKSPKEYGKKLQHLMGWYKKIWNNKPPEYYRLSENPDALIGRHLKDLIAVYERNGESIDQLKRDYEDFLRSWNRRGDKGIIHFRNVLPEFKQQRSRKWTTPKNERGIDYYLRILKEKIKKEDEGIDWSRLDEEFDF